MVQHRPSGRYDGSSEIQFAWMEEILMKILYIVAGFVVVIIFLGWLGVQIKPRPFQAYAQRTPALETIPLPQGLPAPVERYYRALYGEQIPLIKSVVITGRGSMAPFGVMLPARFRFTHVAGKDYRHYIEATLFGLPIMKANERYVDGKGRMEISLGMTDEGEKYNQAANLGLWAETAWFPAVYLTTPGVRWEALDENTAVLVVPFEGGTDHFVVRFDPETGLMEWMESMRYQNSQSPSKTLWLNHNVGWGTQDGRPALGSGAAIWMDNGKPWAIFTVEDIVFNVNVDAYIRATGL
jgi:hypothetical protein